MAESIADRIAKTIPSTGCRIFALRCHLHDIEKAPLDYALQGLIRAGRYVMSDGFIRPAPNAIMDQLRTRLRELG